MITDMKYIILLFIFFLYSADANAQNMGDCPRHETQIKINNEAVYNRLRYNYSKSVAELTRLGMKGEQSGLVFGLFMGKIGYSAQTEAYFIPVAEGLSCLKKAIITVNFYFQDPTVHVGKEFPKDSLEFHRVYRHEMRHAQIYIENYKRYFDHLKPELRDYIAKLRIKKASTDKIKEALFAKITQFLKPRLEIMKKNVEKFNNDFDKKEYEEINWITNYYLKKKGLSPIYKDKNNKVHILK